MSMPSAEVPDIRPRTKIGLWLVGKGERRFHHRGHGEHRGERKEWGEKVMSEGSILFDGVGMAHSTCMTDESDRSMFARAEESRFLASLGMTVIFSRGKKLRPSASVIARWL